MTSTLAPVLGEATIQELREAVHGEIITAVDDGYPEACAIWNGLHADRRPAFADLYREGGHLVLRVSPPTRRITSSRRVHASRVSLSLAPQRILPPGDDQFSQERRHEPQEEWPYRDARLVRNWQGS